MKTIPVLLFFFSLYRIERTSYWDHCHLAAVKPNSKKKKKKKKKL
jgi:hypothetical protein